jgi:ketosteroid isomerase-like protein
MEGGVMKKRASVVIMICGLFSLVLGGLIFSAGKASQSEAEALEEILALELATYETWYGKSDPTAYTQMFADKATYFDPAMADKIEDSAIKEHLMAFAGQIPNFDYEILNPRVDLYGDVAVFTFNLEAYNPTDGTVALHAKSTAVLTHTNDGWKKIHAHWTIVPPEG